MIWPRRVLLLLALLFAVARPAAADEFRPAYLQLREIDASRYDVLWKVPALDEAVVLKVVPQFLAGVRVTTPVQSSYAGGALVRRWRIEIDGGLAGRTIGFADLSGVRIDVLVRLERSDGSTQLGRLFPERPGFLVTASPDASEVARTYTTLGIEHILTGFDHLLFVLALVLLVRGVRRLISTVTAFTVAHSMTLAAATLGWLNIPAAPVEAAIALSIVFVAAEVVRSRQGSAGLTERYPWVVAFIFGLLHGLGFASALAEVGLPQLAVPTALLFFNVGVEFGQLAFIAAVLCIVHAGRALGRHIVFSRPQWLWRIPPYTIGGAASYWLLERVAAF